MKWIITGTLGVFLLLMTVIVILIYKGGEEFDYYHCVRTEETRVIPITTTLIIGKMILPQTNMTEQHKYNCDDQPRWR